MTVLLTVERIILLISFFTVVGSVTYLVSKISSRKGKDRPL